MTLFKLLRTIPTTVTDRKRILREEYLPLYDAAVDRRNDLDEECAALHAANRQLLHRGVSREERRLLTVNLRKLDMQFTSIYSAAKGTEDQNEVFRLALYEGENGVSDFQTNFSKSSLNSCFHPF